MTTRARDTPAREGIRYLDDNGLYAANDPQQRPSDHACHYSVKAKRVIDARLVADPGIEK